MVPRKVKSVQIPDAATVTPPQITVSPTASPAVEQQNPPELAEIANSTSKIALWTGLQLGATLLGLIALIYFLFLNRRAARAAAAAAAVAGQAMEASQRIGEIGAKAYMGMAGLDLALQSGGPDSAIKQADIFIIWRNAGNSPAVALRAVTTYVVQPSHEEGMEIGAFSRVSVSDAPAQTILPGDTITEKIAIGGDVLATLLDRRNSVIVFSKVGYKDVFGNIVEIDWCGKMILGRDKNGAANVRSQKYPHHNRYSEKKRV